jgi:SAM-dependent methyltransferase
MKHEKILEDVGNYYTEKVKTFGTTPKGVDWNSEESQQMRFEQLTKVISGDEKFSILDYGCGYGSLFGWLEEQKKSFLYEGFDISEEMLSEARKRYGMSFGSDVTTGRLFGNKIPPSVEFDYVIASGIFNVKLDKTDKEWKAYITSTLRKMNKLSEKGFAFNILTKYSDKEFMKDNLYYADPGYWFDFCKKNFSKHVALLHDYPLYEFTILVKKY